MKYKIKLFVLTIMPVMVYLIPVSNIEKNPVPCLFRIILNKNCLGCGITRACLNAIHFNFNKAIEYNKLVVIVLPLCILCYISYYYKTLKGE